MAPNEAAAHPAWALAPSWVLSAEGVALLHALTQPATQQWLANARARLRDWQAAQRQCLAQLGWLQQASVTPFWLARPPGAVAALPHRLATLRRLGVQLRDAHSFGLPGWVRLSTQPPEAQQALQLAWRQIADSAS